MKKHQLLILSLLTIAMLTSCTADKIVEKDTTPKVANNQALTEKLEEGKEIQAESCSKCHNTSVYTKEDRKIKNLKSLTSRVQACNTNTGAGLEEEELEALTLYLNDSFYKFKK